MGLAYDYCVGFTALDAKTFGFTTYIVDDCTRAVSPESKVMLHEARMTNGWDGGRGKGVCPCLPASLLPSPL